MLDLMVCGSPAATHILRDISLPEHRKPAMRKEIRGRTIAIPFWGVKVVFQPLRRPRRPRQPMSLRVGSLREGGRSQGPEIEEQGGQNGEGRRRRDGCDGGASIDD